MTLFTWSKTAASNSNADASINWAEGQAPSSVNDSSRAVMAAAAKFRDDISGSLLTAGSSTAYTLTSNQVFTSLSAMDGMAVRVRFHTANGASPTLNVDGLGAKAIQLLSSGTALPTGVVVTNAVHDLVYNNAGSCWIICGPYNAAFASGTLMLFQQTAAPTGWTKQSTHNDKALRVVSGTASSGGSTAFTSIFASRTIAQANLPNVNFTGTPNTASQTLTHLSGGGSAIVPNSGSTTTNAAIAGGSSYYASGQFAAMSDHTVSFPNYTVASGGSGTGLDFAVQYVDLIIASKD